MTRRVVAVYWNDAAALQKPWIEADELLDFIHDHQPAVSVGIEVSRDEHAIHLCMTAACEEVGGVWKIPRKMVRRIQVLGRVEVPT